MNFKLFIYIHSFWFSICAQSLNFRCNRSLELKFWCCFSLPLLSLFFFKKMLELNCLLSIELNESNKTVISRRHENYLHFIRIRYKIRKKYLIRMFISHSYLSIPWEYFVLWKSTQQCGFIYENIPEQSLVLSCGSSPAKFCCLLLI